MVFILYPGPILALVGLYIFFLAPNQQKRRISLNATQQGTVRPSEGTMSSGTPALTPHVMGITHQTRDATNKQPHRLEAHTSEAAAQRLHSHARQAGFHSLSKYMDHVLTLPDDPFHLVSRP